MLNDFLRGEPITLQEIEDLNLPAETKRRLRVLLQREIRGELTPIERIQLDGFVEVIFFYRMLHRKKHTT